MYVPERNVSSIETMNQSMTVQESVSMSAIVSMRISLIVNLNECHYEYKCKYNF